MDIQDKYAFTTHLRNQNLEDVTVRGHVYRIVIILKGCDAFNRQCVQQYFENLYSQYKKKSISASTYNKYRQTIHLYCKYKQVDNYIEVFSKAKEFKIVKRKLGYEESMAFINCSKPITKGNYPSEWNKYTMYWKCMMWIPSRPSEIRLLTKDRFDLENKIIYIIQTKTGDEKQVPLEDAIYPELVNYLSTLKSDLLFPQKYDENVPVSLKSIENDMKKRLAILGIEKKVTPNSLRHSWATRVNANGGSMMGIKALLGHEKLESTMNYIGDDENLLRDTMKADPFLIKYKTPEELVKAAIKDQEKYNFMNDVRFDSKLYQESLYLLWKSIKTQS